MIAPVRIASVLLALGFLLLNGLVYPRTIPHAVHHEQHHPASHATVFCSWFCAAGQALEAPIVAFHAGVSYLGRAFVAQALKPSAFSQLTAVSRGPPVLLTQLNSSQ